MSAPRVSIGMPVYNGGRWLRASLDSLLAQRYADFELIISDNASTDDSEAICREYAARDARIRYVRNPRNIGASDNFNAVFRLARGEYFKWASCNDLCEPDFVGRCVAALDADPGTVLAYPRTRLMLGDDGPYQDYVDNLELLDDSPGARFRGLLERIRLNNVMNGVIRRSSLACTPLIEVYFSSDVNLMAELALHGKFREIPDYLFIRRMDPASATRLKDAAEVRKHYDPDQARLMVFQYWRVYKEYFRAVWRTSLSRAEKLCLYRYLARRLVWDRGHLAEDAWESVKALTARRRARRAGAAAR